MRSIIVFSVAILCATVAFGATLGQTTSNDITTLSTGPITVSAEHVISDSTVGNIKGRGKVTADIHRGRFKLEADEMEISIDRTAGMISVRSRGNVRYNDGSNRTITTNDMMLNVKLSL